MEAANPSPWERPYLQSPPQTPLYALAIVLPVAILFALLLVLHFADARYGDVERCGSLRYRSLLLYLSDREDVGTSSGSLAAEVTEVVTGLRAYFPKSVARLDSAYQGLLEEQSGGDLSLATTLRFRDAADELTHDIVNQALAYSQRARYGTAIACVGLTLLLLGGVRLLGELLRTQRALRESENRFAGFMENGPSACFIKDADGVYVYVNRRTTEPFGTRPEAWLNKRDEDLFPAETARKLRENDEAVLRTGVASVTNEAAATEDGTGGVWRSYKFLLRDGGGNPLLGGMSIDITEQKRAEAQLGISEERYWDLIENAHDLIQGVGSDGRFTFVNRAWRHTLGYSGPALADLTFFNLIEPGQREACRDQFQRAFHDGSQPEPFEATLIAADGRRIVVEGTTDCEREGSRVISIRSILRDVTARKRAERERERLFTELQAALASVRELDALLPICASCKQIRDDDGYWHQLEGYITDHSRAKFSHGICPNCVSRLYPEAADEVESTPA